MTSKQLEIQHEYCKNGRTDQFSTFFVFNKKKHRSKLIQKITVKNVTAEKMIFISFHSPLYQCMQ